VRDDGIETIDQYVGSRKAGVGAWPGGHDRGWVIAGTLDAA